MIALQTLPVCKKIEQQLQKTVLSALTYIAIALAPVIDIFKKGQ